VTGTIIGGGGGGPVGGDGGYFEGDGCVNLDVGFEGQTPTVLLLVDQSGSMTTPFPDGAQTTRWSVLHDALMDPVNGVVKQTETVVRYGLALYTSHGGNAGGMCPILQNVPIALNNYNAIKAVYDAAVPDKDTPTGPSIDAVMPGLLAFAEPGPKYILLVSDGLPDTCEDANPGGAQARQAANARTVASAQAAYMQGVGLFEMGVSADIALDHLQQMANAGAGLDPNTQPPQAAKFWVASSNQADLAAQLSSIVGNVRSCVFALRGTVTPDAAQSGIVRLDGQALPYNDPNGWRLNGPSQLEVLGTSCDKIKNDSKSLSISFPCNAFTPIN
jgi:hypothetical protein